MIDFATLNGLVIPSGEVEKITSGDTILWQVEETPSTPTFTNQAEPNSTNTSDWSIWINDARIGSDGTYRAATGYSVSNYIPITNGSYLMVDGLTLESAYPTFGLYNASKTKISTVAWAEWYKSNGIATYEDISSTRRMITFTNVGDTLAFVRVCGKPVNTINDVIITVNETIV